MIEAAILVVAAVAWVAAAAVLVGLPRPAPLIGVAMVLTCLAVPFATDFPPLRMLLAMIAAWGVFRVTEIRRDGIGTGAVAQRLWHAVGYVDTRGVERVAPGFDLARLVAGLAWCAVAAGGLVVAVSGAARLDGTAAWAARWTGGFVFFVAGVDGSAMLLTATYRALGVSVSLHDAPIRSRSIAELWGVRWNREVSSYLRRHAFRPLARARGVLAGVVAAFGVSALLHAYVVGVAAGPVPGVIIGSFFLLQVPLVIAERALGVARWRPGLARAWTLGAMALVSPLFVEPALQAVEPLL